MTSDKPFNIKNVAIIGAGPAGLASLYEFLHTNKDGSSTISNPKLPQLNLNYPQSQDPAFEKIVVFEQKNQPGGIWAPSNFEADYPVPPQLIMDKEQYHNPEQIRPRNTIPEEIKGATYEKPFIEEKKNIDKNHLHGSSKIGDTEFVEKQRKLINELQWSRSGIFSFLFTNIPQRITRYSYMKDEPEYHDKTRKIYPFMTHQELTNRFTNFIEQEDLLKYIRLSTSVENVHKNTKTGKWVVTARQRGSSTDGLDTWYQEEFDAVIISNGHFNIPFIPHIKGLAQYNANFPNRILHAKNFRDPKEFTNKDVLIIGGGVSTTNVLQYVVPVAKSVTNSKRGEQKVFKFINKALVSKGIEPKPPVEYVDPNTGLFHFQDGTLAKFDKVIFSTGYHYYFPFLDSSEYLLLNNPGNYSRVGGLFLHTFCQKDPTLGTVGVCHSQFNFHTIEASAAALAGVWSGATHLPDINQQRKWEEDLLKEKGNNILFHIYNHYNAKVFVDLVKPYFPKGRYDPLIFDGEFASDVDIGFDHLEKLFYGLKDGTITIEETNDWDLSNGVSKANLHG